MAERFVNDGKPLTCNVCYSIEKEQACGKVRREPSTYQSRRRCASALTSAQRFAAQPAGPIKNAEKILNSADFVEPARCACERALRSASSKAQRAAPVLAA